MTPPQLAVVAGERPQAFLLTPHGAAAAMFVVFGIGVGLWSGASATILAHAGVTAPAFGVAMTFFMAAYLTAMSSGGLLIGRFGLRRVLLAGAPLQGLGVASLLMARSSGAVVVCLVAFGVFAGLVDLTMNAEGARVERALARPIFAGLHGGASTGTALGAIVGSLIAVNVGSWLSAVIAACAFAGVTALIFMVTPDRGGDPAHEARSGRRALLSRALIVLGVIIGVSIASEAAALFWSALLLQNEAPGLAAVSGLGAAFFCGCQALLRLNADRVRRLVSDRRLIIVSLAVASLGFLVVALHAGFAASVVGFAIIGLGTGAVVPCGFALAVSHRGFSAAAALSTVALFGSLARLPAPLAMGAIANYFSLAGAFSLFAVLLAFAVAAMRLFVADD
jgi:MFS family permease